MNARGYPALRMTMVKTPSASSLATSECPVVRQKFSKSLAAARSVASIRNSSLGFS
jgi:hypothetical protein